MWKRKFVFERRIIWRFTRSQALAYTATSACVVMMWMWNYKSLLFYVVQNDEIKEGKKRVNRARTIHVHVEARRSFFLLSFCGPLTTPELESEPRNNRNNFLVFKLVLFFFCFTIVEFFWRCCLGVCAMSRPPCVCADIAYSLISNSSPSSHYTSILPSSSIIAFAPPPPMTTSDQAGNLWFG